MCWKNPGEVLPHTGALSEAMLLCLVKVPDSEDCALSTEDVGSGQK
jgi:hypothetical protein